MNKACLMAVVIIAVSSHAFAEETAANAGSHAHALLLRQSGTASTLPFVSGTQIALELRPAEHWSFIVAPGAGFSRYQVASFSGLGSTSVQGFASLALGARWHAEAPGASGLFLGMEVPLTLQWTTSSDDQSVFHAGFGLEPSLGHTFVFNRLVIQLLAGPSLIYSTVLPTQAAPGTAWMVQPLVYASLHGAVAVGYNF